MWIAVAGVLLALAADAAPQRPAGEAKPAAGKRLSIIQAGIHQTEDGPLVPRGTTHVPGESLFFSFQLDGYQVSPEDKVQISFRVDAFDPKGVRLVETFSGKTDTTVLPQDKDWKPKVRNTIVVPPLALPGTYKIAVSAKDEIGGTTATQEIFFEVRGHQVEPSDTLVVRNIRFLRGEDDREPLAVPAYRAGDALWAKFDITGYKMGPGNTIAVEYGIAIVAPSGKTVFSQPQAAVETGGSFYPKPYVPGIMNLTVQPKTTPGQYQIVITARDLVGHQECEAKAAFRIE
jgi:hypothetical protein